MATEKKNLDELLTEIGRASLLSIDEELALIKVIQEKGPECDEMEKLIEPNMRVVVSVANLYQNQGLTLEELIKAGKNGLEKAVMKYKLEYDFKFIAYAVWWVRQAIIQAINEKTEYGSNKKNKDMESLKEHWKKDVRQELEVRMQKLKLWRASYITIQPMCVLSHFSCIRLFSTS